MKTIALLHTVQSVADTFANQLREYLGEEVRICNLWDDFLANNPNEIGEFTINNRNRLYNDIRNLELTGADMIVVTCSTLTPVVEMIRPFISVPVIAIDDAMGRKAAASGGKIFVLATAGSTIEPTKNKLTAEAAKLGKTLELEGMAVAPAYEALKAVDMERHDALLKEAAKEIKGYDCIVLAQASMAHLKDSIAEIAGCPVFASPALCMEEVKETLKNI